MKLLKLLSLVIAVALSGCAMFPKHNVDISMELRKNPINQVYVFSPFFRDKINPRRSFVRDDYHEMKPENQATSSATLLEILNSAIATSGNNISIIKEYTPTPETVEWAKKIGKDLSMGRIPLNVMPMDIPAQSVLIVGVRYYGYEDIQWQWNALWFKPHRIGSPKWDHTCYLQVILVEPKTGKVLMSMEQENFQALHNQDPELLHTVTVTTAKAIANGIAGKTAE